MLVALIGATSLGSAAMLRWRQAFIGIMYLNLLQLFAHPWRYIDAGMLTPESWHLAAFALGACGIVAAFSWNQRLLTRSSAIYRRARRM